VTEKENLGKQGEEIACGYLVGKGYKILERNFKKSWGELDIVALAPDKTLVFVEVKTSSQSSDFKPEEQMTLAKIEKFKKIATFYANSNPELIEDKKGWRLDLIAIILDNPPLICHYEQLI
jgi:putative endonuclease